MTLPRRVSLIVARVGWILASGPAALLGAVLLHALHVRVYLERWPVVYKDCPETLALQLHEYALIVPAFYVSLFGVPLSVSSGAVFASIGLLRWRAFLGQLSLIIAGIVGIVLLVKFDATGYVEWFLD
jgi:hypothetical protein